MERITLEHFQAQDQHYHIYKLTQSAVAEKHHFHDYYQLCYVEKGELRHVGQQTQVKLLQGDAFLIPPGFCHSISFVRQESELYSLSFHPALFHKGFPESGVYRFLTAIGEEKELSVKLRVHLDEGQRQTVKGLLESLLQQQSREEPSQLSAVPSLISATICILSQAYSTHTESRYAAVETASCRQAVQSCIRYIDENIAAPLTLDALTRRYGIGKSAFYALFQQETGMPLKKYINARRVRMAKSLMEEQPHLTIGEIGEITGFRDASTFYRNFLQQTGVSPAQYRSGISEK